MLPYGVEREGSRRASSSLSFLQHRLPDKLRIVKPLEGSLTLDAWSRLATPHLGGVLEERCGVAIKGNERAGLDPLFDLFDLPEQEEEEEEVGAPSVRQLTKPHNTLTTSTVLHPDTVTACTGSYPRSQMSRLALPEK